MGVSMSGATGQATQLTNADKSIKTGTTIPTLVSATNPTYKYVYTTTATGISVSVKYKVAAQAALTPTTVTPIVLHRTRLENDLTEEQKRINALVSSQSVIHSGYALVPSYVPLPYAIAVKYGLAGASTPLTSFAQAVAKLSVATGTNPATLK